MHLRNSLAAAVGLALAAPLQSQTPTLSFYGADPGDAFGTTVVRVGDCDADGTDDFAVGSPFADADPITVAYPPGPDTGRVDVYSGATGALLWSKGGVAGSEFGRSIAGAGDVNGDGHEDLVVGAPEHPVFDIPSGTVWILSGASGGVLGGLSNFPGGSRFGEALCVGELDGELSSLEVAVGAPSWDLDDLTGGPLEEGRVLVYDLYTGLFEADSNGTDVTTAIGAIDTYDRRRWGAQLVYLGDLDGDGKGSIAVSAPYTHKQDGLIGGGSTFVPNTGFVRVFEPFDDAPDPFGTTFRAGASGDLLGLHMARYAGDLGGDGVADWAVSNLGQQSVTVYGAPFAAHYTTAVPCLAGLTAFASADDVDGDGVADWVAGSAGSPVTFGSACLLSGANGAWIDTISGPEPGDRFGSAVAGFDTDGDGRSEVFVGARSDDTAGADAGAVYAYAPFPAGPFGVATGCGTNPPDSLRELGGAPTAGGAWLLGVVDTSGQQPPTGVAFLAVATAPDPASPCGTLLPGYGMGAGPAPGELLVSVAPPNPVQLLGPRPYFGTPTGFVVAVPNDAAFVGLPLHLQGVLVDPLAGFGLTEGLAATVLP